MNKEQPIKGKEEILDKHYEVYRNLEGNPPIPLLAKSIIHEAMEEYKNQFTTPLAEGEERLLAEIAELKAWKESAMSVMQPMQEIGKALGVKLGESIHDKILPGIERLKGLIEKKEGEQEDIHIMLNNAIDEIESKYPTTVFPENGESQDAKSAMMARVTCNNIRRTYLRMKYEFYGSTTKP